MPEPQKLQASRSRSKPELPGPNSPVQKQPEPIPAKLQLPALQQAPDSRALKPPEPMPSKSQQVQGSQVPEQLQPALPKPESPEPSGSEQP